MPSEYLTVVELLTIHDELIDEFGGSSRIRDMGALEAAVFRPQTGYYDDAIAEAAALMESIIQSHPFLDGNKRSGFAAADLHLRLNGWVFSGDPDDAAEVIVALISDGRLDRAELDKLLRENVQSF